MKNDASLTHPYRRFYTPLTFEETEALMDYSKKQKRYPREQIRKILRDTLMANGYLKEESNEETTE